jgi:hypothetical protein
MAGDEHHPEAQREHVRAVSAALRDLHRLLLQASAGPGDDPQRTFQRALSDPDLEWLRPVLRLIVDLDELVDREEFTHAGAERARADVEGVLQADEFRSNFAAIGPDDPEAVMGLAEVRLNLDSLPRRS